MKRLALLIAALLATDAMAADAGAPMQWRAIATDTDRQRLSEWRDAWIEALEKVRATPDAAKLSADAALFDPDRAIDAPMPKAGDYRCRVVKLGAKGPANLDYVAYPWFTCQVGAGDAPVTFEKIGGSQRQIGRLYPASGNRAVFLGTLALGDERSAITYGRDDGRNVAGWLERIGPSRWRLVMPRPQFESIIDVMEIVPAR